MVVLNLRRKCDPSGRKGQSTTSIVIASKDVSVSELDMDA